MLGLADWSHASDVGQEMEVAEDQAEEADGFGLLAFPLVPFPLTPLITHQRILPTISSAV